MIFGGYNLAYAKPGSTDKDIFWAKQSGNPYYWSVNSDSVKFGDINLIEGKFQQVILDNGMSIAMAPEKAFTYLVIGIFRQSGIQCPMAMLEKGCFCDKDQYSKLASIKFNFVADESGKAKEFEMPKEAYMSYAQEGDHA